MAILSKDQYSRRTENAHKHHQQTKQECKTLTEDQHDVLSWLCGIRHELHSNIDDRWCSSGANFSEHWMLCEGESSDSITAKLCSVGLTNTLYWDYSEIPNDYNYNEDESNGGFEMEYDEAYQLLYSFCENINSNIEEFLTKIDKKHKTSYCPTGTHRSLSN